MVRAAEATTESTPPRPDARQRGRGRGHPKGTPIVRSVEPCTLRDRSTSTQGRSLQARPRGWSRRRRSPLDHLQQQSVRSFGGLGSARDGRPWPAPCPGARRSGGRPSASRASTSTANPTSLLPGARMKTPWSGSSPSKKGIDSSASNESSCRPYSRCAGPPHRATAASVRRRPGSVAPGRIRPAQVPYSGAPPRARATIGSP